MVPPTAKKDEPASKTEEMAENKYELMLILVPDLSQDDLEKELKKIRKQIKDMDGNIYHEDNWDLRDLTYRIKKQDRGYYSILYFTIDGKHFKELEKDLLLNKKVIRHIIVKSPKDYEIKKLSELEFTEEEKAKMRQKPKEEEKPKKAIKKPVVKEKKEEDIAPESEPEKAPEPKPEQEIKPEPEEEVEKKKSKKEETEPEPEEEKPEEPKKEKEGKKKTMDISDLDSQLDNILNDPDMDIKL